MSDLILLRDATIVDARKSEPRPGCHVLVEGDRIREVADTPISAGNATVFDLDGRVVMPGLIDAHAHIYLTEVDLTRLAGIPISLISARATVALREMLNRGFTTLRDAGGADWGMREAVERNLAPGPRLFISGRALSQTGGHGDMRRRTEVFEPCGCSSALGLTMCIADGVEGVQKAAREQLRQGADQIKVMVSGGVASPNDPLESLQYTPEEVRAIVAEATAWKTYVLAHAYTAEAIRHAVEAGVRSIEHGNLIDEPTAKMVADSGAFMVPTLVAYEAMHRRGAEMNVPASSMSKLRIVLEAGLRSIEIARRAGVPLGFGTDLLGALQVDQSREFSIRREVLSAHEIITSATATNARLLMREHELGLVAPGYMADLLVVDGNPLEDLGLLQDQGAHLSLIMKAGTIHSTRLGAT